MNHTLVSPYYALFAVLSNTGILGLPGMSCDLKVRRKRQWRSWGGENRLQWKVKLSAPRCSLQQAVPVSPSGAEKCMCGPVECQQPLGKLTLKAKVGTSMCLDKIMDVQGVQSRADWRSWLDTKVVQARNQHLETEAGGSRIHQGQP